MFSLLIERITTLDIHFLWFTIHVRIWLKTWFSHIFLTVLSVTLLCLVRFDLEKGVCLKMGLQPLLQKGWPLLDKSAQCAFYQSIYINSVEKLRHNSSWNLTLDFPPSGYFQLFNSWINPRWLSVPTRPAFTSPQSETCAQSFLSLLSLCSSIIIVLHFIILTFHPCPHPYIFNLETYKKQSKPTNAYQLMWVL